MTPTGTATPPSTPTASLTPTPTRTTTPTCTGFCDNGDGTITDSSTGLMWEKKSDDDSIHDKDSTYTWSTTGTAADGTAFTDFLANLNTPPCFAGHCDWRLPSEDGQNPPLTGPKELESIVAAPYPCTELANPCVPPAFNTGCTPGCTAENCSCTPSTLHWSASTYAPNTDNAWVVFFYNGGVDFSTKTRAFSVRAVRSGL